MKVLEFAFDSRDSSGANNYLPHNYNENCVVYTGTHDNETMLGWFKSILPEEKNTLRRYLCTDTQNDLKLLDKAICLAMQSVAKMCIIPMQDWLQLDNTSRINKPSTLGGNWCWRMNNSQLSEKLNQKLLLLQPLMVEIKIRRLSMLTKLNNILQIQFQKISITVQMKNYI